MTDNVLLLALQVVDESAGDNLAALPLPVAAVVQLVGLRAAHVGAVAGGAEQVARAQSPARLRRRDGALGVQQRGALAQAVNVVPLTSMLQKQHVIW